MNSPAVDMIAAAGVHKSYRMGRAELHVLRGVDFHVKPGEFVAVVGSSGSGKSTLLHLLGLLDRPEKGRIDLDGQCVTDLSERRRTVMRRGQVGFVFQFYHLLPELNVLENVLIAPMTATSVAGWWNRRKPARAEAMALLEQMQLADRAKHRPNELSGGERQRVAIARALVNQPKLLLADEPTGNLDRKTGLAIMRVLRKIHADRRQTTVMVTHDRALAEQADRIVRLVEGRVEKV